jgi:hypothetical protein
MPSASELFSAKERFPDIPFEAILKTDLLRQGVSFSKEALEVCKGAKPKSYFIFSFDRAEQKDLSEMERRAAPEEIALVGGPYDLKRTIVSVRVNPPSPYVIECTKNGTLQLSCRGEATSPLLADILLPDFPAYYAVPLANGKPVADIAPTIEWGYLIYLTAFRLCQYFGAEEECQFCDINHNYRQQKHVGRPYTGMKSVEEILEALAIIEERDTDNLSRAYTVTGGSVTSQLNGMKEAEFYAQYARAIEKKFPGTLDRQGGGSGASRRRSADSEGLRLHDLPSELRGLGQARLRSALPRQSALCRPRRMDPARLKRREDLRRGGTSSPTSWPASRCPVRTVSPPWTRRSLRRPKDLDYFMSHGVLPRFTVWCVEPNTGAFQVQRRPSPVRLLCPPPAAVPR